MTQKRLLSCGLLSSLPVPTFKKNEAEPTMTAIHGAFMLCLALFWALQPDSSSNLELGCLHFIISILRPKRFKDLSRVTMLGYPRCLSVPPTLRCYTSSLQFLHPWLGNEDNSISCSESCTQHVYSGSVSDHSNKNPAAEHPVLWSHVQLHHTLTVSRESREIRHLGQQLTSQVLCPVSRPRN